MFEIKLLALCGNPNSLIGRRKHATEMQTAAIWKSNTGVHPWVPQFFRDGTRPPEGFPAVFEVDQHLGSQ